ncbi:lipase family protein [Sphingobacterium spiritivorum]|uniref:Triacylglycerol lipase n=1 Tax=Sphingobacterium spiritivorum ATCC 33861 TaxID=525373 RepID=D7VPJ9_SPHSI|nr:lipase family protein [Sphingobacterium spiritivorum]EFK57846.1 triacylglycerol lipase [Sphingobacterium spiritivorum ATCC 33861]WQD32863.1 lipase family protein [Sphingobacterium spiritivorum]SUJ16009.1 Predicted lipase [Sphingobacterium spiritivorum]
MKYPILLVVFGLFTSFTYAQSLKPGFEKEEYRTMLTLMSQVKEHPVYQDFTLRYTSPVMGLENRWWLWTSDEHKQAVIGIRGTVSSSESWLANFYAAMIPAKGQLQLDDSRIFEYNFSDDPKAAVHVGWTFSTGFLSADILPHLDSCYKAGIKDIYITGHSQGGAISYLLTSHLRHLQQQGQLPADIQLKTYSSAAPKVGNLYYAYQYEADTQIGWAFNVVNTMDWVPETPFSVQKLDDFNEINPFPQLEKAIQKQSFGKKIVIKHYLNRIKKPTEKSQKNIEKLLGHKVFTFLKKKYPHLVEPKYFPSSNYMRAGQHIVLKPDSSYTTSFPDDIKQPFMHHSFKSYFYLLDKL